METNLTVYHHPVPRSWYQWKHLLPALFPEKCKISYSIASKKHPKGGEILFFWNFLAHKVYL